MNREEAKELLPIIQAFAEGKEVQYRCAYEDTWYDTSGPTFHLNYFWRIKLEPKHTVGYRQYYFYSDDNEIMFATFWEDCNPKNIQQAELSEGFIKWKHTDWQYDDVEVE